MGATDLPTRNIDESDQFGGLGRIVALVPVARREQDYRGGGVVVELVREERDGAEVTHAPVLAFEVTAGGDRHQREHLFQPLNGDRANVPLLSLLPDRRRRTGLVPRNDASVPLDSAARGFLCPRVVHVGPAEQGVVGAPPAAGKIVPYGVVPTSTANRDTRQAAPSRVRTSR